MGSEFTKLYFLRLEKVARDVGSLSLQLVEVDRAMAGVGSGEIDVFYASLTESAMLVLRVAAQNATGRLSARLHGLAKRMGAEFVEIGRKPQAERRRFYQLVMPLYETRFVGLSSCVEAFAVLRERVGLDARVQPDPALFVPACSTALRARFRRGDQWQAGRVRQLTSRSLALATGCPPCKSEVVEVELSIADISVVVAVAVVAVTQSGCAATMGSMGFGARMLSINSGGKDHLNRILQLVREQRLINPPPPRRSPRFPVSWPLLVGSAKRMLALDLSSGGMFVASRNPPALNEAMKLCIAVELGQEPLRASGQVVRVIDQSRAELDRLPMGFGLTLSLGDDDGRRYQDLVTRVAGRAQRHVVVGASGQRLPQITRSLAAVGYAASSAGDSVAFLQKAAAPNRMPDLVLLDSSLQHQDLRTAQVVARALSARKARTIHFDNRPTKNAWQLVDEAFPA